MKRIPFLPLPLRNAVRIAKPLRGIAARLERFFPALSLQLYQAGIKLDAKSYLSCAILASLCWFALFFPLLLLIFNRMAPQFTLTGSFGVSGALALMSFLYINMYPKLLVARKIREMERCLLYALRHLTIQIKSGVPLYDSLVSLTQQDYGLLSKEVAECVKKISTGWSTEQALDELALRNPSPYFRRIVWQITNAMRSGVELGGVLENALENLIAEHRVAIRRYGSQLSPLVMLYMMLAVLIPSMGITFLFILASFTGLPLSETLLWLTLGLLAFFQFSFVGLVKSRRPSFEV